ncbi:unnamed protein product [Ambrosiozyma monospora]|uniref:Unnamed protein product n=1 Tax=Ambrosiozyma monospora TaxID=43982 RepID=A0A9W6Z4B0_AMBMO|nr:unnamed protein product [Ambrosiozyma monospora]
MVQILRSDIDVDGAGVGNGNGNGNGAADLGAETGPQVDVNGTIEEVSRELDENGGISGKRKRGRSGRVLGTSGGKNRKGNGKGSKNKKKKGNDIQTVGGAIEIPLFI